MYDYEKNRYVLFVRFHPGVFSCKRSFLGLDALKNGCTDKTMFLVSPVGSTSVCVVFAGFSEGLWGGGCLMRNMSFQVDFEPS